MDNRLTGVMPYSDLLQDMEAFSREVLKRPLYGYQLEAARAVLESVRLGRGEEFLLIMSRQSGKNELVAQLLVYLLNVLQRKGGHIVYAAIGDNIGRGISRLDEHLDNAWNKEAWKRERRPLRRRLGKASVVFMSSHPGAHARGETAHHLLVVDELQDQDAAHVQAVFQPMRAARNATAVYLGTVRTTHDALWRKKEELERLQARDGVRRVFMVGPEAVCAENADYERFLAAQIAAHGRRHPLIASEYFLEPLDRDGGLFPARRVQLMRGRHGQRTTANNQRTTANNQRTTANNQRTTANNQRTTANNQQSTANNQRSTANNQQSTANNQRSTANGRGSGSEVYIATLDVAGIDEAPTGLAATDVVRVLDNPARDYTTCTVFRVAEWQSGKVAGGGDQSIVNGPVYEAVDVFVDQGSQHFREHADGARGSGPSLARQLLAFLQHWQVAHLVGDATGVGEGLLNWLAAALGESMVTPFKFTRRSKAQLGADFVALVETNRFKYFREEHEFDDAWWFFEQARQCAYELEVGRPLETHLRWFVPATTRVSTPAGPQPLHDDRLISAALIAEADRLVRSGKIRTGRAESVILPAYDPLEDLPQW